MQRRCGWSNNDFGSEASPFHLPSSCPLTPHPDPPSVWLAEPPHLAAYQKGLHSSGHRFPDTNHKSEPPGQPELLRPLAKRAKVRDAVQTRGLVRMLQLSSPGHVWGTLCQKVLIDPTCPQRLPCCFPSLPMTDMG